MNVNRDPGYSRISDLNMALCNNMDHIQPHGPQALSQHRAAGWITDTSMAYRESMEHGGLLRRSNPAGNPVALRV